MIRRSIAIVGILLVAIVVGMAVWLMVPRVEQNMELAASQEYAATQSDRQVVKLGDGLGAVTRVKLTPDEQVMLVTNLAGDLFAFLRTQSGWVKQEELVYHVDHGMSLAGENGMTGLIISSQYRQNQNIFLTYTQRQSSGRGENTVLRLTLEQREGKYIGTNPMVVFRGNTQVLGAHQIQGGTGVVIEGKPHLLFAIGEGYQERYARELQREAGKLILIQEDGSNPLGQRPYPEFPRLQAIGIRNVYDITLDPKHSDWVYFTQNGPSANDVVIHAPVLDGGQYDFNWQNENRPADLLTPLRNGAVMSEYVIRTWTVTVSPNDIAVDSDGKVYVTIFSSARYPHSELVMGEWSGQEWKWQVVAERKPGAEGGNALGLTLARGGVGYFGDLRDGAVYGWLPQ